MAPQPSPRPGRPLPAGLLLLLLSLLVGPTAWAQVPVVSPPPDTVKIKEPQPNRVYQRERNGRAAVPIAEPQPKDSKWKVELVGAALNGNPAEGIRFEDGKLVGVPTGGPYQIECRVKVESAEDQDVNVSFPPVSINVGPIFVGDLWVLAGQSNMEGYADLIDVTPPDPKVMALGMDGVWRRAEEPLHWLVDSPDPVHSGNPDDRAKRSADQHKNRSKGAGLGLPFAEALVRATGVPVGLVPVAHGGTSLDQWNPDKKEQGGKSLYGSMLRQVKLAGNRVTGVLWYQGESDASGKASEEYQKNFTDFIAAVRSDLNQPELPLYYVQLGRWVNKHDPQGWNLVRDVQRRLPERVPNTAVVAAIDLELDDGIHIGTHGQKRLGHRLAQIALRELFGQVGASTPTLERVSKGSGNTLIVKFRGVNLSAGPRMGGAGPSGAPGMMGPGMGMMRNGMMSARMSGLEGEVGLRPARHIGGFSIRDADGQEVPLIYEAAVGPARDTVVLKLTGKVPDKASLWYGYGLDPYCNLTDGLDMAVTTFGPISLDDLK